MDTTHPVPSPGLKARSVTASLTHVAIEPVSGTVIESNVDDDSPTVSFLEQMAMLGLSDDELATLLCGLLCVDEDDVRVSSRMNGLYERWLFAFLLRPALPE